MQNPTSKIVLWIVLVIIVASGAFFLFKAKTKAPTTDDVIIEPIEDTSDGSQNSTGSTNAPKTTMTYAQALATYADKRIQLDTTCQAHPNNVTYKNGTSIMIDNRSPQAVSVHIGATYAVKAYGFKIIKLTSATLPSTLLIDCGVSQNVATILLQK